MEVIVLQQLIVDFSGFPKPAPASPMAGMSGMSGFPEEREGAVSPTPQGTHWLHSKGVLDESATCKDFLQVRLEGAGSGAGGEPHQVAQVGQGTRAPGCQANDARLTGPSGGKKD